MNIEDFKIQVTEEQSKIVQEVLFKNGYKWRNGWETVGGLTHNFIVFDKDDGGLGWQTKDGFFALPTPEITFEQFKEMYMKEEKALRYNNGKPKWGLVEFKSLEPMVKVLEYGCTKYEKDNWKKGLDTTEILESLSRHLFALMSGEEVDSESQLPHIGHIMCNAMFYQYHKNKENGL